MEKSIIEAVAPTVEEAIDKGLTEMGRQREEVDVEVLDEGKRNIFRFASRDARVRLTLKGTTPAEDHEVPVVGLESDSFADETFEEAAEETPAESLAADLADEEQLVQAAPVDLADYEEALAAIDPESEDYEGAVRAVLGQLLNKMEVKADFTIETRVSEDDGRKMIMVNIEGQDLGYLIGRKSETLNALQYITSLIVSHKMQQWVPLQIDIQNYRSRRENELRKLARRMADQVLKTGRKQFLEPMPANERRIIHMELRENPDVETESVGEEPNRKVSIHLKGE